jgi:putative copper resistance protein D
MDNYLFLPRAIASALYDLAFAAAVGVLLCRLWLRAHSLATTHRALRFALITCTTVLLLSLAAQVILTTAMMTGTLTGVTAQIKDVLLSTHAGRLLIPALIFAVFLLALSLLQHPFTTTPLVILFALAVTRSATGHAASTGDFTLPEAMQLLHLTSTALWSGSVLATGLLVIPHLSRANDHTTLTHLAQRLSAIATIAVFLVILSGIYNAWLGLSTNQTGLSGSLPPLVHTQWGILLTLKSTLVTIAALLGLYNRILLRRAPSTNTIPLFTRTLRIEALLITTILTLSAFLANSSPPMSS